MRILYLGKRHNMDIDSIGERHGRAYHLPWELSQLGHDVSGLYIDYRSRDGHWLRSDDRYDISVLSLRGRLLPRVVTYYQELLKVVRKRRPEVVIAGSDSLNVVIGAHAASRLHVPFVADVKDDYTAFGLTRNVPFLERAYYRALEAADFVTCVSPNLEAKLRSKAIVRTMVLENAVPAEFVPNMTKDDARQALGLPQDMFLLGVTGAICASRDIDTVFQGARKFFRTNERAALVLAGPRDKDFKIPQDMLERVHDVGQLAPSQIPQLLRALDVGVIPNTQGDFGAHCYPQKYREMLACGLPVVAANVGVFSHSEAHPAVFLYEAGVPNALCDRLIELIRRKEGEALSLAQVETWGDRAISLDRSLRRMF